VVHSALLSRSVKKWGVHRKRAQVELLQVLFELPDQLLTPCISFVTLNIKANLCSALKLTPVGRFSFEPKSLGSPQSASLGEILLFLFGWNEWGIGIG
jgi:hypothetical protein